MSAINIIYIISFFVYYLDNLKHSHMGRP
jgi:hypothetical protein